ncbi:hypothetical protein J1605_009199, partial [Eschrichtius robustus]
RVRSRARDFRATAGPAVTARPQTAFPLRPPGEPRLPRIPASAAPSVPSPRKRNLLVGVTCDSTFHWLAVPCVRRRWGPGSGLRSRLWPSLGSLPAVLAATLDVSLGPLRLVPRLRPARRLGPSSGYPLACPHPARPGANGSGADGFPPLPPETPGGSYVALQEAPPARCAGLSSPYPGDLVQPQTTRGCDLQRHVSASEYPRACSSAPKAGLLIPAPPLGAAPPESLHRLLQHLTPDAPDVETWAPRSPPR